MAYHIKLEAFEGPLDLLFHLIEKHEIDLYDIPITQVTEQYIAYLKGMEELDLEIASEFLVMAATLLEIKSKMLLPIEATENQQMELEALDPRYELVQKLLEYKKYKLAAESFKERENSINQLYFKPREELIFETEETPVVLEGLELSDLLKALEKALAGKKLSPTGKNTLRQMQREVFTIEDKIQDLLQRLNHQPRLQFSRIFNDLSSRTEIITTFLALLELIRLKEITVKQEHCFTDIIVEKKIKH